jgi:hypothetical protein
VRGASKLSNIAHIGELKSSTDQTLTFRFPHPALGKDYTLIKVVKVRGNTESHRTGHVVPWGTCARDVEAATASEFVSPALF